jgi:hypothetical protein
MDNGSPAVSLALLLALGLTLHPAGARAQTTAGARPATAGSTTAIPGCSGPRQVREATAEQIQSYVRSRGMGVLTFLGYSGAGYNDPEALRQRAQALLEREQPQRTLINIGASAEGIGAVYAIAKQKGFRTIGIVSSLARDGGVALSPCVDLVFVVRDQSWGGKLPGSGQLSPTSAAIVTTSTALVAIGGGDVARDELLAARQAGKPVRFYPADMNHRLARQKARQKGLPAPHDFRGSAHRALVDGP